MRKITLALFVLGALAGGCKSSTMNDVTTGAKNEACKTSCDEAKTECFNKCTAEADQDACKIACDVAKEQCVKECKQN